MRPEDTLIHLGDVCFRYNDTKAHQKWVLPMPGRKILVRGNHDKKSCSWYMDNGWDFACDYFVMKYEDMELRFTHRPPFDESFIGRDIDLVNTAYICGHQHQNVVNHQQLNRFQYVISLEQQGYGVQSLDSVLCSLRERAKLE